MSFFEDMVISSKIRCPKRTGHVTFLKIWSLRALQTVDNKHPVKRSIIPEE